MSIFWIPGILTGLDSLIASSYYSSKSIFLIPGSLTVFLDGYIGSAGSVGCDSTASVNYTSVLMCFSLRAACFIVLALGLRRGLFFNLNPGSGSELSEFS